MSGWPEEEKPATEKPVRSLGDRLLHPGSGLNARVVHAGAWSLGLRIALQVFKTAKLVILARLLAPNDFGLMGVALVVLALLETLTVTGFDAALIQRRGTIRSHLNTAWTIELLRKAAIAGLLVVGAPLAVGLFNEPAAVPIIRALALAVLISGFVNIGIVHFQRELEFQKQFVFQLAGTVAEVGVGVAAALITRDVWALVYGAVAGNIARVAVSYAIHAYRPRLELNLRKARELYSFGKWVLASDVVVYLLNNVDYVVVGRLLGAPALGLYRIAFQISQLVATELTLAVGRVMFPAYSMLQAEGPRLRRAYLRTLTAIALAAMPFGTLLALLAGDLAPTLLGPRWSDMAGALALLSLAGLLRSLASTTGPLFRGIGRPGLVAGLASARLAVLVPLLYPMTTRWGLTGTAGAVLLSSLVVQGFSVGLGLRTVGATRADAWRAVGVPAVLAGLAAGAVVGADFLLAPAPALLRLLLAGAAGGVAYLAGLFAAIRLGYDATGLVPRRLRRNRDAVTAPEGEPR